MVEASWLPVRLSNALVLVVAAMCASVACASSCPRERAAAPPNESLAVSPVLTPDPDSPDAPVGTLPLGAPCGPDLGACDGAGYCAFPPESACGAGAVPGICEARPRGCFKDCPGVCGCDGVRYCNTCAAQGRGFSVRYAGNCGSEPAAPLTP